ncbi:hypothetical protein I6N90_02175 [Paenibacillus sp. GSMTC-2017]|uniref:DUF6115 domain-containing protein n=1 Tax=Paenibacillus sp. GSMTC-2017 TaxID=2794350 RepID=UPI0018D72C0B|nr:hypothetical protein [Paenibacillus sp. GSMTC-2017]MBH5316613.1 hypothetical protein [Paenibacillus sp. GSMTC-2017]
MQPLHYILLVGAVVIVGAFVMPKRKQDTPPQAAQSVRNMETALEQFMENMEKDNEDLVKLVVSAQQSSKLESEKKDDRIIALEKRCQQLEEQLQSTVTGMAAMTPSVSQASQLLGNTGLLKTSISDHSLENNQKQMDSENMSPTDHGTIHARYPELFQLYTAGKSIESIAKKLGMNKGEVQLIIGLAKQEGSQHV